MVSVLLGLCPFIAAVMLHFPLHESLFILPFEAWSNFHTPWVLLVMTVSVVVIRITRSLVRYLAFGNNDAL